MDKKQKDIVLSAVIKLLTVVYIVVFIVGMVKLLNGFGPAECFWELVVIFLLPVIGYFLLRSRRKVYFPASICGLEVHPEGTKKAFRGRMKAYIFDSLQYAVVISVLIFAMDLWDAHSSGMLERYTGKEWLDITGSLLLQLIVFFAIYFVIDCIMYELKAKKYMAQRKRAEKRKKEYRKRMEVSRTDDGEQL